MAAKKTLEELPNWKSTQNKFRHRKPIEITLSERAHAALDAIATRADVKRSRVVSYLLETADSKIDKIAAAIAAHEEKDRP